MHSIAVLITAIVAVTTGSVAGGLTMVDMSEFDLNVKVVDSATGLPVADASVEITDGNGVIVAQGLTDEDGTYELQVDDQGADDNQDETDADDGEYELQEENEVEDDDQNETDESPEDIEDQDEATLNTIVGPLTVTISKDGYVTQTLTVDLNTLNDSDLEVELQPVA